MGPVQGVHPKVSGSFLLAATAVALCRRAGDTGRDGKAQACLRTGQSVHISLMPPMLSAFQDTGQGQRGRRKRIWRDSGRYPHRPPTASALDSDALDNDHYHFLCVQRWEDVGKCC